MYYTLAQHFRLIKSLGDTGFNLVVHTLAFFFVFFFVAL